MSFPTTAHDCYDAEESPVESSCGLSKGRRGLRPETAPLLLREHVAPPLLVVSRGTPCTSTSYHQRLATVGKRVQEEAM